MFISFLVQSWHKPKRMPKNLEKFIPRNWFVFGQLIDSVGIILFYFYFIFLSLIISALPMPVRTIQLFHRSAWTSCLKNTYFKIPLLIFYLPPLIHLYQIMIILTPLIELVAIFLPMYPDACCVCLCVCLCLCCGVWGGLVLFCDIESFN